MGGRDRGNRGANVLANYIEGRAAYEGGRHVDGNKVALHVNIGNHAHLHDTDDRDFRIGDGFEGAEDSGMSEIANFRFPIAD